MAMFITRDRQKTLCLTLFYLLVSICADQTQKYSTVCSNPNPSLNDIEGKLLRYGGRGLNPRLLSPAKSSET